MDSLEEKILTEYIAEVYPGCGDAGRDTIKETVGFKIHFLSYYHKQFCEAIKERMTTAQEQFIRKYFGS